MTRRTSLISAGALALAAALAAGCGTTSTVSGTSAADNQAPAASSQQTVPDTSTTTAPAFTVEQQQAILSAQNYLDSGMGFSRAGLLDQLTSPNGEGFSHKLARFALAHVQVNWNRQAVISAKNYLHSGMGFSYSELVQQLESPYGEQFTPAQAQHGAMVAFR